MKRINKNLKHCYIISIPNISEYQEEQGNNTDLTKLLKLKKETEELGLPTDLIEQKIKEIEDISKNQSDPSKNNKGSEIKEFETKNTGNSQENQESSQETQKPREIPKNPKMYYYQIMDHFESYPSSYFDGSDITLDSYRPINKRNSSNIVYILVRVLIPEDLEKQPDNWLRFLSDSQEIQQKQFEVLSKGDVQ